MPRVPRDGKPTLGITRLGKGDYAVYALSTVSDGNVEVADEAAKQREIDNLKRLQGRSDFNHLLYDMKGPGEDHAHAPVGGDAVGLRFRVSDRDPEKKAARPG